MTVWQSLRGELCVLAILTGPPLNTLLPLPLPAKPHLNSAQQIFSHLSGVKRLSDIIKFAQVCNKLPGDFAKIEMKTHSFIIVLKWGLYRV